MSQRKPKRKQRGRYAMLNNRQIRDIATYLMSKKKTNRVVFEIGGTYFHNHGEVSYTQLGNSNNGFRQEIQKINVPVAIVTKVKLPALYAKNGDCIRKAMPLYKICRTTIVHTKTN